ncbi:MAG: hypothetical protein JJT88_11755 [Gammaproteobacteria bacterium]|nr:hypothetical protein [Gammaproteobacteria bacterium]
MKRTPPHRQSQAWPLLQRPAVLIGSAGLLWVLALAPLASASETAAPAAQDQRVQNTILRPNFTGHWEQDYARSDRWDDELYRTVNELQREALLRHQRGDGGPWVLGNARRQARSVMAKARLADMVTGQGAFEIVQTREQVRIERAGDAPLICSTITDRQETFDSVHGRESCAWERQQLLFEVVLPEGVTIEHRFSLDPGGDAMSVLTRVSSRDAPPFALRQFYQRYDKSTASFRCVQTLSRGQVCSTEDPGAEVPR